MHRPTIIAFYGQIANLSHPSVTGTQGESEKLWRYIYIKRSLKKTGYPFIDIWLSLINKSTLTTTACNTLRALDDDEQNVPTNQ